MPRNRKSSAPIVMDYPEVPAKQLREEPQHPTSSAVMQEVHDLSLSVERSLSSLVRAGGPPVGLQMGGLTVSVTADGDTQIEAPSGGVLHDARDLVSMAALLLGVGRFFNVGRSSK